MEYCHGSKKNARRLTLKHNHGKRNNKLMNDLRINQVFFAEIIRPFRTEFEFVLSSKVNICYMVVHLSCFEGCSEHEVRFV